MRTLFDSIKIKIRLDDINNSIECELRELTQIEDYMQFLELALDFFVEKKCNKILIDMHDLKMIPDDAISWMETIWIPKMINAGNKFFALINKTSAIANTPLYKLDANIEKLMAKYEVITVYFESIDIARSWIANMHIVVPNIR